jgi:polysaccharide pyruvyl transferase WcaK-like protein
MNIVVYGSYNGTSIGDTAILLGLLHGIAQVVPDAGVTVLSMGPLNLSRDLSLAGLVHSPRFVRANVHAPAEWPVLRSFWWRLNHLGVPLDTTFNHLRVRKVLTNQDLLVIGGGNLLMDFFPTAVDLIENISHAAQATATPYCFAGVGAGPVTQVTSAARLAACLAAAQNVVVRDALSHALCAGLLKRADTLCAPDFAFALPAHGRQAQSRNALAINVAAVGAPTWPVRDLKGYQLYLDGITRLVLGAAELTNPACIEIIITNTAVDRCAAQDLASRLAIQTTLPVLIPVLHDVTDILDAFGRAKFAITTRLHAGITAALAGTPVLPVAYQPKVASVLAEAGISTNAIRLVDLHATDRDLSPVLAKAIRNRAGLCPEIRLRALAAIRDLLLGQSGEKSSSCIGHLGIQYRRK